MTRRILLHSILLMLTLTLTLVPVVLADGGKAMDVKYRGFARSQAGNTTFDFNITTNPAIFYLGTVNGKYHVLLIRVDNGTDMPLNLAKDQDTILLRFDHGQVVKGLLAVDPATWEGLENEVRRAVAYPKVVPPHEEEGICVFVPVSDVIGQQKRLEMPGLVIYNIKSLGRPVELRQPLYLK